MSGKISEEVVEGVKTCLVDKKNPGPCIDKILAEHDIAAEDKAKVLTKVAKSALE